MMPGTDAEQIKQGAGQGPRILLVEDDLVQAHLLRHLLEGELSARVVLVQDGDRGIALVGKERWDLVIADINLPGASGLEVAAATRRADGPPVLVTTGYTREDYRARALASGAAEVLTKPLVRDTFLQTVTSLLGGQEADHEPRPVTVLAVGAYPGDVEGGCAGALLAHRNRGDRVVTLILFPDGRSPLPEADPSTPPPARDRGPLRTAARQLGSLLVLGNLPRVPRPGRAELTRFLETMVRDFAPETIYTPSPHSSDPEQHDTYWAVLAAARAIPNVYCYQAASCTVEFRPSLFADVEPALAAKEGALEALGPLAHPDLAPEGIRAAALYWGRFTDLRFAEPLEVVRGSRDAPWLRTLLTTHARE